MNFSVIDETSSLISLIIGIANNLGPKPELKDLYDPKSIENLKSGNYPLAVSYTHLTLPTKRIV